MNPQIKERWIAALRSGEYKQGKGALKTVDGKGKAKHCCLGVLCELAVQDGVVTEAGASQRRFGNADWNSSSVLPEAVVKWAGLTDLEERPYNPTVRYRKERLALAECNDGANTDDPTLKDYRRRLTFKEIARIIERQL